MRQCSGCHQITDVLPAPIFPVPAEWVWVCNDCAEKAIKEYWLSLDETLCAALDSISHRQDLATGVLDETLETLAEVRQFVDERVRECY